ncbi:hypothetical protein AC623_20490 [Bacillus sp. FJAT-27231]|uniref:TVP38/TMEM64 family protein n=1 Tax=Bacillus sp. FJAT-27231 TaxID=1679168 RepID=UPI000670A291|nr:VTT domain-containing protein [Bacillus sp. FJAT-27231]KMY52519.1 hypothetical protein AC623_20490 [Bacillus sp. FJAT-27231]
MENELVQWLPANPIFVFLISTSLNIIISISGFLPSAFITTANIAFFGFKTGLLVSIIGEAGGAIISFILYRHSLNKVQVQPKNRFLKKLKNKKGMEAIILVVILRILPFIPSGLVTLTAAFSQMRLLSFSLASTFGKIPSLFIEAYSINQIFGFSVQWQIVIFIFIISSYLFYKIRKVNPQDK